MEELTLAQGFTIISLNSLDSLHMTTAKRMALRCISAAVILELYLEDYFTEKEEQLVLNREVFAKPDILLYQEEVLKHLFKNQDSLEGTFAWWLGKASTLSDKSLKRVEHTIMDSLKGLNLMEEIPNLLGCDLFYTTADITMREYRSNSLEYNRQTEGIRSEVLEEGKLTDEDIVKLWLLRESACLSEIFTKKELDSVLIRFNEMYQSSQLAKRLFEVSIHHMGETAVKNFLTFKKQLMSTPFGTGLNFDFPFIERSQSVFIETEAMFSNPEKRLEDVLKRLNGYGHEVTVLRGGAVPLLKIDNILYEAVADAIVGKIPVHGIRLRRYQI
ncbi:hypothetical protein GCM10023142_06360 [Anaerocolumna aminovalerica]|jgi:hypothetical protein|uniref:Uncharacterized protein n=1 Tax=Anaerocolumna aminovalerica TaxID=1527 RepID=A0A1I5CFF3_9FIRM|nr:hypothetical protein [Anaerocolumna aminovalerica]SFN85624.1 hypothetical protein SAMN04489757_10327 [Anaerocolumna aminovalerica]